MPPSAPVYPKSGKPVFADGRTLVMGILNVTPDSFSDGGRYGTVSAAVAHACEMDVEGADIIDLGAESTRPGSLPVPAEEQLRRILPVLEALRSLTDKPISIDTTSACVARKALDAGAAMINDISALRHDPAMAVLAAERGVPVVLMHMQGLPLDMQHHPAYTDVTAEVAAFLEERRAFAVRAGIRPEQVILDPGFGFGKTVEHNLELFAHLRSLARMGPLLVGVSRKSFIGATLDLPVDERLEGSLALATLATAAGARILRVHDVRETVRTVRMTEAVLRHTAH